MKYSFTLKDNNQKAYNQFTWFLFFLHIIAAALFALNAPDGKVRITMYVLLGFYAVLGTACFIYRRHKKVLETFSLVMALLYAHFWFQQVGIVAALIFAAVYIGMALLKGKRTAVLFTDAEIQLTRVLKTAVFPWAAMSNVVLKDNVLTIDFKTNKILQVEIAENNIAVDEFEFNQFCTNNLSNIETT